MMSNDSFRNCLDSQRLGELLSGSLQGKPLDRASSHIEDCERCQSALEKLTSDGSIKLFTPEDLERARLQSRGKRFHEERQAEIEFESIKIPGVTIHEKIGQGGMGTVYRATENEPIKRSVALKIIRGGRVDAEFTARFQREQSLLASVEHPYIARLYGTGQLPDGAPYFLMEFAEGQSLVDYCVTHRLGLRERLALFICVCDAVQFLHTKQIIHRDLKPSNIMVTQVNGEPMPKVIDFGLAKFVSLDVEGLADQSIHGSPVGTLRYMSPEQTGQIGIPATLDATTDIYSLGVILYELITGDTPLDRETVSGSSYDRLLECIRNVEPQRPSDRILTQTSDEYLRSIQSTRHKLAIEASQDLDWIVLKALRKPCADRFRSVDALIQDLQDYLNNRPVEARPPGKRYFATKYYRRNRAIVWAMACLVIALTLGVGGTSHGLLRARQATHRAEREAERALLAKHDADRLREEERSARILSEGRRQKLRTAASMLQGVFDGLNPETEFANDGELRKTLLSGLKEAGTSMLSEELAGDSDVLPLKVSLANSLSALGDSVTAARLLERVVEEAGATADVQVRERLEYGAELTTEYFNLGRFEEANKLASEAYKVAQESLPKDDPMIPGILHFLAIARSNLGHIDEAIDMRLEIRDLYSPDTEETSTHYYDSLNSLAILLEKQGKMDEAEEITYELCEYFESTFPPDHPYVLGVRRNLALVHSKGGSFEEAIEEMSDVLEITRITYPTNSNRVGDLQIQLALMLSKSGDLKAGLELFDATVQGDFEESIILLAKAMSVATRLKDHGENLSDESRRALRQELEELQVETTQKLGAEHPTTRTVMGM